ncbi:hypothetical protein PMAYCL1PPCAC_09717, partial [Pristionchus mayeri]
VMDESEPLIKVSKLSLGLSIVEFLTYPIAVVLTAIAVAKLVKTSLLPSIIRALICLTLCRVPISMIRRSYVLVMRIFVYGSADIPLQVQIVKWRKLRVGDHLSAKSTYEENMRCIRLVIPLLLHENICHLATLATLQTQVFIS